MDASSSLREHLIFLLNGGGAHISFEAAISDVPEYARGMTTPGVPHTLWGLLEHMKICQWDILRYSIDADHVSPEWPQGCWPADNAPPNSEAWDASIDQFRQDLETMKNLITCPETDLFAPIPHGQTGHTILREALLLADHNAYHLGQFLFLRRALGIWQVEES